MVTTAPLISSLDNKAGMAVISFDFLCVLTCPSTTPFSAAKE
ncbi:MAG: hypothetical protein ACJASU_000674 [Cognaticolwellia sp.]|jgi:hypothetical protein